MMHMHRVILDQFILYAPPAPTRAEAYIPPDIARGDRTRFDGPRSAFSPSRYIPAGERRGFREGRADLVVVRYAYASGHFVPPPAAIGGVARSTARIETMGRSSPGASGVRLSQYSPAAATPARTTPKAMRVLGESAGDELMRVGWLF
jgi:hypothetical protein